MFAMRVMCFCVFGLVSSTSATEINLHTGVESHETILLQVKKDAAPAQAPQVQPSAKAQDEKPSASATNDAPKPKANTIDTNVLLECLG